MLTSIAISVLHRIVEGYIKEKDKNPYLLQLMDQCVLLLNKLEH